MKTKDNNSCVCNGCATTGTILGIIAGIITGILFALGNIPLVFISIWIALATAAFVLIYVLSALFFSSCSESCNKTFVCLRKNIRCLLVGTLGTIITALAALSIVLVTTSIFAIVLVAFSTFFFTFLIVALISLIKCMVIYNM